jgi:hypothetical protein
MKAFSGFLSVLPLCISILAVAACGGSGSSSGTSTSSNGSTSAPPQARTITTLTSVPSGGSYSLSIDNGRIYYTDYNGYFINSIGVDGLNPTIHLQPPPPPFGVIYTSMWPIQKIGDNIYTLQTLIGGQLLSIPAASQGTTAATSLWQGTVDQMPADFTVDDSNIYWVVDEYHLATTSFTSEVYGQPIAGGPTQHLGTVNSPHPQRISQYGDALFVATNSLVGGGVFVLPKVGGAATTLVTTSDDGLNDVIVRNDVLFFTYHGIHSIDLNSKVHTSLVPSSLNAYRMYFDDQHLYWSVANRAEGTGSVNRIRLSSFPSPTVETLYSGAWSWQIAGDAGAIYWAAGNAILTTTK